MSSDELNNSATNEVASAEAELRAAQEALEAAKSRLAELKEEHPPLEPGKSASETEALDSKNTAPSVDETAVEVEAVIVDAASKSNVFCDASGNAGADFSAEINAEAQEGAHAGEQAVAKDSANVLNTEAAGVAAGSEPSGPSAPTGASVSAPSQEPVANWIPYSTAPAAAVPVAGAANGDPSFSAGPTPPAGATPPTQQPNVQQQPYAGYEVPSYGQTPHAGPGAVPPQQPYYGYQQNYYQPQYAPTVSTKDHVAAGLLAIFLGQLGIHKFYLGYNTSGFIMLAVTIIGSIFTFGLAGGVMWIIAVIEGIMYLTKSQSEFEQMYVVTKREWF